jgi:hypothetical protein
MQKTKIKIIFALFFLLGSFSGFISYGQSNELNSQKKFKWMAEDSEGWYNVTTFSFDFFKGPLISGMQTIIGYKLNPHIAIGGGIGLERYVNMNLYDELTANFSLLPVFTDIRYTMLNKRVTPVIAMQVGYKFLLNRTSSQIASWDVPAFPPAYTHYDEYDYYDEGGMSFTIEAGVKMKVYQRLGIYLSAAYSLWSVSGDHYKWAYAHLIAPGGPEVIQTSNTIRPTEAYNRILLIRLGISL